MYLKKMILSKSNEAQNVIHCMILFEKCSRNTEA